jgi:hypothetical protein
MRNISTVVKGHYDDDRYMWAIIIRRFCDIQLVQPWQCPPLVLKFSRETRLIAQVWVSNAACCTSLLGLGLLIGEE